MHTPASRPRPAATAAHLCRVGETLGLSSGRRRQQAGQLPAWRLLRLAGVLIGWLLLGSLVGASVEAQGQQRGFQAPPQRGSGPLEVDITQGTLKPIPIAIPEFAGEDQRFAVELSNVVAADLERSGLFQPLNRESFIQRLVDHNATPRFSDWRAINAQALWSAVPDAAVTAGSLPNFASGTSCPGGSWPDSGLPSVRASGAASGI